MSNNGQGMPNPNFPQTQINPNMANNPVTILSSH